MNSKRVVPLRHQSTIAFVLFVSSALVSCGEVESVELPNRPSLDTFDFVQDALRVTGCSAEKCHAVLTGDFKVTPKPVGGIGFTNEYQLTKRFINLQSPAESRLLTVALAGAEDSFQHPVCFQDTQSCSYRIVLAWISALGPQDTQPNEINCMPIPRSCTNEEK